jgi:hypothetical protein
MTDAYLSWEKLAKLSGGRKDPFADPYGPTEECFSANDLVRMFRLGALTRDVKHLTGCEVCRERIQRYAVATGLGTRVSKLRNAWRSLPTFLSGWSRDSAVTAGRVPTLVHVPATCFVDVDRGSLGTVRVHLLTNTSTDVRNMTLRLEGPVTAGKSGSVVDVDASGFAVVEFYNVQASGKVLKELGYHTRITDQVVIRADAPDRRGQLVGTSNIELQKRSPRAAPLLD